MAHGWTGWIGVPALQRVGFLIAAKSEDALPKDLEETRSVPMKGTPLKLRLAFNHSVQVLSFYRYLKYFGQKVIRKEV